MSSGNDCDFVPKIVQKVYKHKAFFHETTNREIDPRKVEYEKQLKYGYSYTGKKHIINYSDCKNAKPSKQCNEWLTTLQTGYDLPFHTITSPYITTTPDYIMFLLYQSMFTKVQKNEKRTIEAHVFFGQYQEKYSHFYYKVVQGDINMPPAVLFLCKNCNSVTYINLRNLACYYSVSHLSKCGLLWLIDFSSKRYDEIIRQKKIAVAPTVARRMALRIICPCGRVDTMPIVTAQSLIINLFNIHEQANPQFSIQYFFYGDRKPSKSVNGFALSCGSLEQHMVMQYSLACVKKTKPEEFSKKTGYDWECAKNIYAEVENNTMIKCGLKVFSGNGSASSDLSKLTLGDYIKPPN